MVDTPKIPVDLSKLADITKKIDLKGIMGNVKSIIGMGVPVIPESSKDNPVGFRLSNLTQMLKALEESNGLQAQIIRKLGAELGALYKDLHQDDATPATKPAPKAAPKAAAKPVKAEPKAAEKKETK